MTATPWLHEPAPHGLATLSATDRARMTVAPERRHDEHRTRSNAPFRQEWRQGPASEAWGRGTGDAA